MSLINYDVKITDASLEVGVGLTPQSLTVNLDKSDISFDVQPATGTIVEGAVAGAIVGAFVGAGVGALFGGGAGVGTVYAVAAVIKSGLEAAVGDAVGGLFPYTYSLGKPLGYSIDLGDLGVTVGVTLSSVSLGTYDGMLLASGTVQVS